MISCNRAKRALSAMPPLPTIILTAFGSTRAETQATFDRIEADARRAFPDYPLRWAFTSSTVRAALSKAGREIFSPAETIRILAEAGVKSAVIQSLHIMPGAEYADLLALPDCGLRRAIGRPLLADASDIADVARIVGNLCAPGKSVIVAAHGNANRPELNAPLLALAAQIEAGRDNVALCTIEGPPGVQPMEKIRAAVQKSGTVLFIPLMLTAGVHVRDDLLGNAPDSWRNRLGARAATVGPALGDLPEIRAIFLRHLADALREDVLD